MEIEDYWSGVSSDSEVASPLLSLADLPELQPRKNATEAHWMEELEMAKINSPKGSRWKTTGIARNGKPTFLVMCRFLAEIGALHLLDDKNKCISFRDIAMKFAQGICGLSWEAFQVYKHLKSLDYIVKRHGVCWTMKHVKPVPTSVEGESNGSEDISSLTKVTERFRTVKLNDEVRPVFDVYPPNSNFKKSSPGDPMFIICINHDNPSTKEQIEDLERQYEGIPWLFCYVERGRENDAPDVAVAKLFASAKRNSTAYGNYGAFANCLHYLPSERQIRATGADVQTLLVSARKMEALHRAQEGQIWGITLLVASQLGDQLVAGSPLRMLCLLIAGQPADVFLTDLMANDATFTAVNMFQQPAQAQLGASAMLDDWEENLAMITANRTMDAELVLIKLGDCLWKETSNIITAHICYLVAETNFEPYSDSARLCLIGADDLKYPRTYAYPEAIQL